VREGGVATGDVAGVAIFPCRRCGVRPMDHSVYELQIEAVDPGGDAFLDRILGSLMLATPSVFSLIRLSWPSGHCTIRARLGHVPASIYTMSRREPFFFPNLCAILSALWPPRRRWAALALGFFSDSNWRWWGFR